MPPLRHAQLTECFHLAFLQVLHTRLDQSSYVLKGGTNLRYFFESVRYSEDIDLDARGIESWLLAEKVNAVLTSPAIERQLLAFGLSVESFCKPKQTETTQRWKVSLRASGQSDPIRTEIEFSRRNGDDRYLLEAVPSRVVTPYALRAPAVMHYTAEAALEQKAEALAGRSETQARDVFDLDLLLRRQPPPTITVRPGVPERAAERALDLPYAAFRDQVLPFLDPEIAELYVGEAVWTQMQSFVVESLLETR
jgi:predicted nucleotidyltransferase component of viral defense system